MPTTEPAIDHGHLGATTDSSEASSYRSGLGVLFSDRPLAERIKPDVVQRSILEKRRREYGTQLTVLRVVLDLAVFFLMADWTGSIVGGVFLALLLAGPVFVLTVPLQIAAERRLESTPEFQDLRRLEEAERKEKEDEARRQEDREKEEAKQAHRRAMKGRVAKEFWTRLTGLQFEKAMADLYEALGFEVEVTPFTGDDGIDLKLRRSGKSAVVQCKAHANPIGADVVDRTVGAALRYGSAEAIVASVGGFTPAARRAAIQHGDERRVTLLDLEKIIDLQCEANATAGAGPKSPDGTGRRRREPLTSQGDLFAGSGHSTHTEKAECVIPARAEVPAFSSVAPTHPPTPDLLESLSRPTSPGPSRGSAPRLQNPGATLETSQGAIFIRLFPEKAPRHVRNFIHLAEAGFYDGTLFHRVVPGFMVQGGDPLTKDHANSELYGTGGNTDRTGIPLFVEAEFNDVSHTRGILSMARASDPDSASSQFFIIVKDSPFLDGQYTAFGEVMDVDGMEVVDRIVAASNADTSDPCTGGTPRTYQRLLKVQVAEITSDEAEQRPNADPNGRPTSQTEPQSARLDAPERSWLCNILLEKARVLVRKREEREAMEAAVKRETRNLPVN